MKILLIDNFDSFTYNIVELLRQLNYWDVDVIRNDQISISQAKGYDKIILSPGPSVPGAAGNMLDLIKALSPTHSILGICLGHQGIAEAFGARLKNIDTPFHGVQTTLEIIERHNIYKDIPISTEHPLRVGLYHSWVVDEVGFPECLVATAISSEKYIMSLKHKSYDVHGIQFHPESYLTTQGHQIMKNWLES